MREVVGDDAKTALLFVEEDDEWFAVLRVDADNEPRVFVSDARVIASSDTAALFGEAAVEISVDDDADADEVAWFEFFDGRTDGFDGTDDLVTGHHGIDCVAPFVASGVNVGMADAAPLDVDVDVVVVEFAAVEFEGREGGGGALCGIAVGLGHAVFLLRIKYARWAEGDS